MFFFIIAQNVSHLGPLTMSSTHKPLGEVRLQPLQHKNLAHLSHNTYPTRKPPAKRESPESQILGSLSPWSGQSTFPLQGHVNKQTLSEPINFPFPDRPLSPSGELLAPLPRKASRPPSVSESTNDDPNMKLGTPFTGLKPLTPPKEHTGKSTGRVPDLNKLEETPLWLDPNRTGNWFCPESKTCNEQMVKSLARKPVPRGPPPPPPPPSPPLCNEAITEFISASSSKRGKVRSFSYSLLFGIP